jgi:uncharacterized protein (UPF0305 family)
MDIPRLRTLTMKSILWFGKYEGMTISQIIALKHTRYLRWIYYNIQIVNFMEDVFNEIHILEKDRIEKPGTNPEKYDNLNRRIIGITDDFTVLKSLSHTKKNRKMEQIRRNNSIKYKDTKTYHQRINHGHKVN